MYLKKCTRACEMGLNTILQRDNRALCVKNYLVDMILFCFGVEKIQIALPLGSAICIGQLPLISFRVDGQIDPFNVLGFAMQTFLGAFCQDKRARAFNTGFNSSTGMTVLPTVWNRK